MTGYHGDLYNPPVKACKSYGLPEINYTFHDEPNGVYLVVDITDLDVGLYPRPNLPIIGRARATLWRNGVQRE